MKAKKISAKAEGVAAVVYRIHTLLHTVRAIERHEEHLCGIMTEIRLNGAITAALDEELRDLLEQMPAHEYLEDVDAVRQALGPEILMTEAANAPSASKPKGARKSAKKATRTKIDGRAAR